MLRPSPQYHNLLARAGLAPKDIIVRAPVPRSTYFGWLNPASQPSVQRRGGIRLVTAWNIARVYAEAARITEEAAFAALFVETDLLERHATDQRSADDHATH